MSRWQGLTLSERSPAPVWLLQLKSSPVTLALVMVTTAVTLPGLLFPQYNQFFAMAPGVVYFEPWRLFTAALIHFGPVHLLLNMWMLVLFGPALERVAGRAWFLGMYVFSALAASVFVEFVSLYVFQNRAAWTGGASGALFGLLGSALVLYSRLRVDLHSMLVLLGINLAYSFVVPGISWEGHLGGLLGGLLFAAVILLPGWPRGRASAGARWALVGLLFVAVFGLHYWMYQPFLA